MLSDRHADLYHEVRRKPDSVQKISGRAVANSNPGTVAAPINKHNPTRPTRPRAARSTAPNKHYVVILSGG